MQKISFMVEDGTVEEFFIEEQTKIAGINYLLVSDSQGEEATAYILKDVSSEDSEDACYEMVEDEDELNEVWKVFELMMDDVDMIKE